MVKKNDELILDIVDNGIDGEGIAKIDGYTLFINGAIKGEKVKALVLKTNKTYGYAKVLEFINKSEDREEPLCPNYARCGGCNLQHMSYEAQLKFKEEKVKKTITKALTEYNTDSDYEDISKIKFETIIGMGIPYYYRNKAQYPCQNGKIGFYSERTHSIIENETCYIQDEDGDKLAKRAFELLMQNGNTCYDEVKKAGNIRHIMTRVGKNSGEQMLVIVTCHKDISGIENIIEILKQEFTNLKSIIQNINNKPTNIILGKECITLFGEEYIVDRLGDLDFKISPLSFYQVNPVQTEVLYNTAIDMAKIDKNDTIFDLYCGIGTISLFLAKSCKKVVGVEIVPEAIEDAKENAKLNKIENAEFYCGLAEEVVPRLYEEGNMADIVFVDPPRKGCDKELLDTIIKMKPKKVVYISCNVATLGRDLKILSNNGFSIETIQPVDQFPQTAHCESIALLRLQ